MNTTTAQQVIKSARIDGIAAGRAYIAEFGIVDARIYAKQLGDETPKPSNAMFGYIDGFMNAVVE